MMASIFHIITPTDMMSGKSTYLTTNPIDQGLIDEKLRYRPVSL